MHLWEPQVGGRWRRRQAPVEAWARPKPVYRNQVACRLYWIYAYHPDNPGQLVLAYVGETSRLDFTARWAEHLGDFTARCPGKPWADTVPTRDLDEAIRNGWVVLGGSIYESKNAVWEAEEEAIVRDRPLYNHEYNLGNPGRVEIWRQAEQRAARDRAAGVPVKKTWAWLNAEYNRLYRDNDKAGVVWWRRIPRRWQTRAWWAAGWAVAVAALWALAGLYVPALPAGRAGGLAACAVTFGVLRWKRPYRRGWERAANGLLRLAVVVAAVWLVAPLVVAWWQTLKTN